jgi:hypothetical protein
MVSGSISLPYSGFFSPFPHGTSSLSVSQEYLALADGPARFIQGFTCPALLRIPLSIMQLTSTGLSPSLVLFSKRFLFIAHQILRSYNPNNAVTLLVWAIPRSLATTSGITIVFSSSGYLDVSVHQVCFLADDISSIYRVAPFGNLRINSHVLIPATYRSLSRPSSPLRAKAFPIRP